MPKVRLVELDAHGLATIENARLEFDEGFTVITGETGAGKTLLLDALAMCLGDDPGDLRSASAQDLRVAALFVSELGELSLAREMTAAGRLRGSIDGTVCSSAALRERGGDLVTVHGQHDSLRLRTRAALLDLLDRYGGIDAGTLEALRREHRSLERERHELGGDLDRRRREQDLLEFQIAEIDGASITGPHELEETLEELTRLSARRDAATALRAAAEELDGDQGDDLASRLARVVARLPDLDEIERVREGLRDAVDALRDGARTFRDVVEHDEDDPGALERLSDRVDRLQHLVRKHGTSLADVLEAEQQGRARLEHLRGATTRLAELDDAIEALTRDEEAESARLRADRIAAADRLARAVTLQLPRVALPLADVKWRVDGVDGSEVALLFRPNPGLPAGSVASLASGGELSRLLLAIALETARDDTVAIFDEIDAGVGGQVAQQIGDCLAELGERQQVVAVTHLASVAARARRHFVIEKGTSGGRTSTWVRRVDGDERVGEIARMLVGDPNAPDARALAQRLLDATR